MNWSRAKTILIIMFLFTAIFQSLALYNSEKKLNNISPEIIASSVKILSANNISVNSDIIPTKNYSLPSVEVENAVSDYYDFAKLILGSEIKKISDTEYSSDVGSISFFGNSFTAKKTLSFGVNAKNETQAQNGAKAILENLNIKTKDAIVNVNSIDDGYEISYKNSVDNTPLFNSELSVSFTKNNKFTISGNWFNEAEKTSSVKLKSITAVLIDLINEEIEKPAKITNIALGYIVPESDKFQKSASLIPVWQITLENGKTLTFDARSPQ